MHFLKSLFKRPVTIIFSIVLMIVIGVISTSSMAVNLLPNISFPYLSVVTTYVGASAEVVETNITVPLEHTLSSLTELRSIQTYSMDNASALILEFEYGANIEKKIDEANDKIKTINLPQECSEPTFSTLNLNATAVSTISIFSSSSDSKSLYNDAEKLKSELANIDGVSSVSIKGAPTQTIQVSPIHGLESATLLLVQALSNGSYDIPLGSIQENEMSVSVVNNSKPTTIDEIKNLPLEINFGTEMTTTFVSVQELITRVNNLTTDDLNTFKDDAFAINDVINYLESADNTELDNISSSINSIQVLTRLTTNYSSTTLQFLWDNVLKNIVQSDTFLNMTDTELETLSKNIGIDLETLKWIQNNSKPNTEGQSEMDNYWKIIVDFRIEQENEHQNGVIEITDEEYALLIEELGFVNTSDVNDPNYIEKKTLLSVIEIANKTNSLTLNNIITKLKNDETVSNSDYALLFIGNTSSVSVLTSSMLDWIRSEYFSSDFDILYQYKLNHQHIETTINPDTNLEETILVADYMSSEDLYNLYTKMHFQKDIVPLQITVDIIDFIRNVTFTSDGKCRLILDDMANIKINEVYDSSNYFGDSSINSLRLEIYSDGDGNTSQIVSQVERIINNFECKESNGDIVMIDNQAAFINDSLSNAVSSLIIGGVLAIIIIYLFLRRIPSSLIIAVSMPLSILCTLACLYFMGITLNMVSVGGLAVGIGMLVDNSIVVLESITSEKAKGKSALEASVDGTKLVIGSLVGSTLTSICVFFPILLIDGLTKEIFRDLSLAVIFSLTFSLIVAVLVIPTLYIVFYKNKEEKPKKKASFMEKLKDKYGSLLTKILHHRTITLCTSLFVFAISMCLVFTTGIEFMPSIDQGQIEVNLKYTSEDDFEYCNKNSLYVYDLIEDNIDNIKTITMSVASQGLLATSTSGLIHIQLDDNAKRTQDVCEDIRVLIKNSDYKLDNYTVTEIDGVVASLTGGMAGVSFSLEGDNLEDLKTVASKIEEKGIKESGIRKISDDILDNQTTYTIKIDPAKCQKYGIDYSLLVQTLRVGLAGYQTNTITVDSQEKQVEVIFDSQTFLDYYETINNYVVGYDSNGNPITLANTVDYEDENKPYVGSISIKKGPNVIKKIHGNYVVTLSVETYQLDTGSATSTMKNVIESIIKDYPNITYSSGGVSSYLTEAFSGLVTALVISFFLLFGIMACLFESLKKPLIVIFSIPLSFTGGFLALLITRVSLNIVSFIGFIMLMGVIVNDAIVLLERIQQLIDEENYEPHEAVIEGCKQRLRAVLMTTLTTVLALFPMALGLGEGGALMQPLGIVAFGGMCLGTIVTLVLIPTVYCLIHKIRFSKKRERKKRSKKTS